MITRFEPTYKHSATSYQVGQRDGIRTVERIGLEAVGLTVRFDDGTALLFRPEGTCWLEAEPEVAAEPSRLPVILDGKVNPQHLNELPVRKVGK